MRVVCHRCGVVLMLLAIIFLVTACFQTANVQQNTGLQLVPASSATSEATTVAVVHTSEPLPILLPTSAPTTGAEETFGENPTPLPQLSAAQIEATSIVIEATNDASLLEATFTNTPDTADEENSDPTEGNVIQVYVPDDEGTPAPSVNSCIHIVQNGDTLYNIARQYNTTVSALVTLNSIPNSDVISIGQQIYVPGCGTELTENSSRPEAASAQVVVGPEITHVVQEGEGLFDIALRYGVTVTSIAQANNITDVNTVFLGQVLVIPAGQ